MDIQEIRLKIKKRFAIKFEYGIDAIEEILNTNSSKYNDFTFLKGRLNRMKEYINNNTLDFEKIDTGENKIYVTFLNLVDSLELKDLKKQDIKDGIVDKTLANRRVNYFKLIEIYMQILNSLSFAFDEANDKIYNEQKVYGREAIYQIYHNMSSRYLLEGYSEYNSHKENLIGYLYEILYKKEKGLMEVYLKNIKNIIGYINEDEVDKIFFINTFKSLLSRFELAVLFYFSLLKENSDLKRLLIDNEIINKEEIKELFFDSFHESLFEEYFVEQRLNRS